MKFTIAINNEKQQARIDRLRGNMAPKEFILRALEAGMNLIEQNAKQEAGAINFAPAKPEFKTLDVAAIAEALKGSDAQHPVRLEVTRLVSDYTEKLRAHAKKNGNRLPSSLKVQTRAPIEGIAFKITVEAINNAVKTLNKKAAAK